MYCCNEGGITFFNVCESEVHHASLSSGTTVAPSWQGCYCIKGYNMWAPASQTVLVRNFTQPEKSCIVKPVIASSQPKKKLNKTTKLRPLHLWA